MGNDFGALANDLGGRSFSLYKRIAPSWHQTNLTAIENTNQAIPTLQPITHKTLNYSQKQN